MTDFPIVVRGLERHSGPKAWGDVVLITQATVEIGPLLVVGATLVKAASGQLQVWLPKAGRERRVTFVCRDTRARVVTAICDAYRAFTGIDPQETPLAKASTFKDTFDEHPQT